MICDVETPNMERDMTSRTLAGLHVLVVEDEYFLAEDARTTLVDVGAEVVGPVPTAEEANALIERGERIDYVLLDVNLSGEMAFDVADVLRARGVPFAFVTGYDPGSLPERFGDTPTLGKPVRGDQLIKLVEQVPGASPSAG